MKTTLTLVLILAALMLCSPANATEQEPEILLLDGKTYYLLDEPLESLYETNKSARPLFELAPGLKSSGNWRGYIGVWTIQDGRLYLTGIKGVVNGEPANLQELFQTRFIGGKVHAEWVDGTLRAGYGEVISYQHMGFSARYQYEIYLTIRSGNVNKMTEVHYRPNLDGHFAWFTPSDSNMEKLGPYCSRCLAADIGDAQLSELMQSHDEQDRLRWFCGHCNTIFDQDGNILTPQNNQTDASNHH
ncbi:MAG: hypothetical protein AB7T27_04770 [Kiritimatiellia bacterium]